MGDPGSWFCQLCSAGPLMTRTGTRRHYKNHSKNWDWYTDSLVEMDEVERAQQMLTRELRMVKQGAPSASETEAKAPQLDAKRHRFMGRKKDPSSPGEYHPSHTHRPRNPLRLPTKWTLWNPTNRRVEIPE